MAKHPKYPSLTVDEVAAIQRGVHPVSPEAIAWAEAQMAAIAKHPDTSNFKNIDEFRAEVYRRFPHLARNRKGQPD